MNSVAIIIYNPHPFLVRLTGVEKALQLMKEHKEMIHLQKLLQENANVSPSVHPYRGYALLNHESGIVETEVSMQTQV